MKKHIVLIRMKPASAATARPSNAGMHITYGDRPAAQRVLRQSRQIGHRCRLGEKPGACLVSGSAQPVATLPIIFLTARDSDIDSVHGLRLGADDYVAKDMNMNTCWRASPPCFGARKPGRSAARADDILTRGKLTLNVTG